MRTTALLTALMWGLDCGPPDGPPPLTDPAPAIPQWPPPPRQLPVIEQVRADTSVGGRLVTAAADGDLETLREMLADGFWPEGENQRGQKPLQLAAAFGRTEAIRVLVEAGAGIDEPDGEGWSPLGWAAWQGSPDGVLAMLALGADPNGSGTGMPPPIMMVLWGRRVAEDGHAEPSLAAADRKQILRALLEAGADSNLPDAFIPPLELAIFGSNPDQEDIALLLAHGARLWRWPHLARIESGTNPHHDLLREAAERGALWRDPEPE